MSDYEHRRLENIKRNKALINELGLPQPTFTATKTQEPPAKRRKIAKATPIPSRVSARIASAPVKPEYNEDAIIPQPKSRAKNISRKKGITRIPSPGTDTLSPAPFDVELIRASWTSWTPSEPLPTVDSDTGCYAFPSHPTFRPNLSPASIIRQGAFGGTYFRPYYSKTLRTTVSDDWQELPFDWTAGLGPDTYLTSSTYNPSINKFGVSCGQTIEEWEAAGWIRHEYDIRGWFQWYCRFFLGRRCDDDERQISRWRKCAGETGRWRRMLLKRYKEAGVRSVADEGADEDEMVEEGERRDVSPVMHQTCWHWAWEVRQDELDRLWAGS